MGTMRRKTILWGILEAIVVHKYVMCTVPLELASLHNLLPHVVAHILCTLRLSVSNRGLVIRKTALF